MLNPTAQLAALYATMPERIAACGDPYAARHRARLEDAAAALRADGEILARRTAHELVVASLERYRIADAAGEVVTAAHAVRQARWWEQVAAVLAGA